MIRPVSGLSCVTRNTVGIRQVFIFKYLEGHELLEPVDVGLHDLHSGLVNLEAILLIVAQHLQIIKHIFFRSLNTFFQIIKHIASTHSPTVCYQRFR